MTKTTAEIYDLDKYRKPSFRTSESSVGGLTEHVADENEQVRTVSSEEAKSFSARPADMDELYPRDAVVNATLNRARQILRENEKRLAGAQNFMREGDFIGADNEISLLQADIVELFLCRTLSDGFASLVVALHHALRNRGGSPLTELQLACVRKCILSLYENTFLSFSDALSLVEDLQDVELITDPPESEYLEEALVG